MMNGPAYFSLSSVWWCYNGQAVSSLTISYLLSGTNVVKSLWKMHFTTVTLSSVSFPVPKPQTRGSLICSDFPKAVPSLCYPGSRH